MEVTRLAHLIHAFSRQVVRLLTEMPAFMNQEIITTWDYLISLLKPHLTKLPILPALDRTVLFNCIVTIPCLDSLSNLISLGHLCTDLYKAEHVLILLGSKLHSSREAIIRSLPFAKIHLLPHHQSNETDCQAVIRQKVAQSMQTRWVMWNQTIRMIRPHTLLTDLNEALDHHPNMRIMANYMGLDTLDVSPSLSS